MTYLKKNFGNFLFNINVYNGPVSFHPNIPHVFFPPHFTIKYYIPSPVWLLLILACGASVALALRLRWSFVLSRF